MWWNAARFWSDMWDAGSAMTRNGLRAGEMAQASVEVIDSRTRSMLAACRDPLNGDYAEFARMVPEKVAAFWEAGSASLTDIQAMQAAAFANWQQATAYYHSATPDIGADYQRKVMAVLPDEQKRTQDTRLADLANAWAATTRTASLPSPNGPVTLANRAPAPHIIPLAAGATATRTLDMYRNAPIQINGRRPLS